MLLYNRFTASPISRPYLSYFIENIWQPAEPRHIPRLPGVGDVSQSRGPAAARPPDGRGSSGGGTGLGRAARTPTAPSPPSPTPTGTAGTAPRPAAPAAHGPGARPLLPFPSPSSSSSSSCRGRGPARSPRCSRSPPGPRSPSLRLPADARQPPRPGASALRAPEERGCRARGAPGAPLRERRIQTRFLPSSPTGPAPTGGRGKGAKRRAKKRRRRAGKAAPGARPRRPTGRTAGESGAPPELGGDSGSAEPGAPHGQSCKGSSEIPQAPLRPCPRRRRAARVRGEERRGLRPSVALKRSLRGQAAPGALL